ncbi:MAG: hypothetical protein ACO1QB_10520 [Verrucomicrobiales bacterium]
MFAIVSEGKTDQAVIENILLGHFHGQLSPGDIVREQPPNVLNAWGGWMELLKYLEAKRYRDVFQFQQYIVIQIDTDICEQAGICLRTIDGRIMEATEVVTAMRHRLEQSIGPEDLKSYEGRFLMAISVHSIECWLLPLLADQNHFGKINNCHEKANRIMARENKNLDKRKIQSYMKASELFRHKKTLNEAASHQASLQIFLDQLSGISLS